MRSSLVLLLAGSYVFAMEGFQKRQSGGHGTTRIQAHSKPPLDYAVK